MAHDVPPTLCPVPSEELTPYGTGAEAAWGFFYRTGHLPPDLPTTAEWVEFLDGWHTATAELATRERPVDLTMARTLKHEGGCPSGT